MKDKINIAELLKDCPTGMELDCTMYENIVFDKIIEDDKIFPIRVIRLEDGFRISLTKYGQYVNIGSAKCIIFPKGKTTWEGFVPPSKFKDGDILATDLGSVFYLNTRLNTDECYGCYVGIGRDGSFHVCVPFAYKECCGLATKEEKEKLFQAIKDNGYKWNAETKTLEKLVEPKFKVGDRITLKNYDDGNPIYKIIDVKDTYYVTDQGKLPFYYADPWKLVTNKFDINTLVPFESRVLMRSSNAGEWVATFYSHYSNNKFYGCGMCCSQCIPYEGNEHLIGKTDDCDEHFKIWK